MAKNEAKKPIMLVMRAPIPPITIKAKKKIAPKKGNATKARLKKPSPAAAKTALNISCADIVLSAFSI